MPDNEFDLLLQRLNTAAEDCLELLPVIKQKRKALKGETKNIPQWLELHRHPMTQLLAFHPVRTHLRTEYSDKLT